MLPARVDGLDSRNKTNQTKGEEREERVNQLSFDVAVQFIHRWESNFAWERITPKTEEEKDRETVGGTSVSVDVLELLFSLALS